MQVRFLCAASCRLLLAVAICRNTEYGHSDSCYFCKGFFCPVIRRTVWLVQLPDASGHPQKQLCSLALNVDTSRVVPVFRQLGTGFPLASTRARAPPPGKSHADSRGSLLNPSQHALLAFAAVTPHYTSCCFCPLWQNLHCKLISLWL